MRKCIIIFLLLQLSIAAIAQERYALLIGIGNYPEESGWNKIHGNNDIVIIKNALLNSGFVAENITELLEEQATYSNIISSIQSLIDNASKGDVFYIHFSGHGQQITDTNGDESDYLDEAWIPYDAPKTFQVGKYEGQNHITDDLLNSLLTSLRIKIGSTGKITVIADACHSGSGTRGYSDEEIYARGTSETFILPSQPSNIVRKESPVDWLFVAACKPFQTNYEYQDSSGVFYGPLSYIISQSDLSQSEYKYLLEQWGIKLSEISSRPQEIDPEGKPSKKSNNLL